MLELHTTEDEMAGLEAKYCNDTGFNYSKFLAELVSSLGTVSNDTLDTV